MRQILFIVFLFLALLPGEAQKVFKVLAIGNSFSVDAIEQYLYELAHAKGDSLVIGNAYIGGCSIDRHWGNTYNGKRDYSYRKIVGGVKVTRDEMTLKEIIQDDEWDLITVQQASPVSGVPDTYNHLKDLMDYVRKTARKPFRFAFHETWAYSKNYVRKVYEENYQSRPIIMYQAILNTVWQETKKVAINDIIPCGVSIQRARALLGDSLNRDGFHLEKNYGRYVAACTWYEFLTGKNVLDNPFYPPTITPTLAFVAQKSAHEGMEWQKRKFIEPKYFINGEFFEECPESVKDFQKQIYKASDGREIISVAVPKALPDEDRFYYIPEFKIQDVASLKAAVQSGKGKKLKKICADKGMTQQKKDMILKEMLHKLRF